MPYKSTMYYALIGGAIGLLIVVSGSLIVIPFLDQKIEYVVGLTIPAVTALIVWFVKFSDQIKKEDMANLYRRIAEKADSAETNLRIDNLQRDINDHKFTNNSDTKRIFDTMDAMQLQLTQIYQLMLKK
jgi:hypothetical protein